MQIFRKLLVSTILFFSKNNSYSKDVDFKLSFNCKKFKSDFKKVSVIDRRPTDLLSYVQKGGFNKITPVNYSGSISDDLIRLFQANDSSVKKELTIILYELNIVEKSQGMEGRLKLSMRFFVKDETDLFKEALTVDTIVVYGGLDITSRMLRGIDEQICRIAKMVVDVKPKTATAYNESELNYLDSLEKLNIPIYNTTNFNCGVYKNYSQFKNNTPDTCTIIIDSSDVKNLRILTINYKKNKRVQNNNDEVYGVCDGSTIYKATYIGFYPLKKIDNDFYYEGKTSFSTANNNAGAFAGALLFGVAGGLAASTSQGNIDNFLYMINYRKGNSIPVSREKKK